MYMTSNLENALIYQMQFMKLAAPETEYRFALEHIGPGKDIRHRLKLAGLKDWRFDFAWPDQMFAVEVEGITPAGGRHQRIKGYQGRYREIPRSHGFRLERVPHHRPPDIQWPGSATD
jgi:hypothetical protein